MRLNAPSAISVTPAETVIFLISSLPSNAPALIAVICFPSSVLSMVSSVTPSSCTYSMSVYCPPMYLTVMPGSAVSSVLHAPKPSASETSIAPIKNKFRIFFMYRSL